MTRTASAHARTTGLIIGCLSLTVLTACGGQPAGPKEPADGDLGGTSRYVQTWSKDYDGTDCAEWATAMTGRQRWTAALDMLKDARGADDAFAAMPSEPLVDEFRGAIDATCAAKSNDTIAQVGAEAYQSGRTRYRP